MIHRKYSSYTFLVGSEWHDSYIKVEAYTKADAMKEAKKYKVRPDDHCKFIDSKVLLELKKINNKYEWVEVR